MATRDQKYRQAALAYLLYGIIYLSGALYIARAGLSERTMGPGGGFLWFAVGALFVVVFPVLVWRGFKWFTRVLAGLLLFRIAGLVEVILTAASQEVPLPWGGALPMRLGAAVFLLVAIVTAWMLARAGWDLSWRRRALQRS